MTLVTLNRTQQIPDGVFGEMLVAPDANNLAAVTLRLVTVEDDWLDNAHGVSCIPAGVYTLVRTIFHRHNLETFEVVGVPNRSRILLHPANTEEDLEGCVGVGHRLGEIQVAKDEDSGATQVTKLAALESRVAHAELMAALAGQDRIPFLVRWGRGLPHGTSS